MEKNWGDTPSATLNIKKLPLGICHVWGQDVLAMSVGSDFKWQAFMCDREYRRSTIWPQIPEISIAQEHLLLSRTKNDPVFINIVN